MVLLHPCRYLHTSLMSHIPIYPCISVTVVRISGSSRAGDQVSRTQSLPFLGFVSTLSGQAGGAHFALLPERLGFQSPHCLPGAIPADRAEILRRIFSSQRFIVFVKF